MQTTIVKSVWLAAQQCAVKAWFEVRANSTVSGESEHFRMQQGQEIGVLARSLYPNGVLVAPTDTMSSSDLTLKLVAEGSQNVVFEATFSAVPFAAKADILENHHGILHILEVKSSFSDSANLSGIIDD